MITSACGQFVRQLASSYRGVCVAAAKSGQRVTVWDVQSRALVRDFEAVLDFGGRRLAISGDDSFCAAASFDGNSVQCYETKTGKEVWSRQGITKPQKLEFTPNSQSLSVATDGRVTYLLDTMNGATIDEFSRTTDVYQSPFGPATLMSRPKFLEIRAADRRWIIPRETFAELDVAFGVDRVCISESAGSIRCIDIRSGTELWRFGVGGFHAVRIALSPSSNAFFAVEFQFERVGGRSLWRLDARDGSASRVVDLDTAWEAEFCLEGRFLLGVGGAVIETATGNCVAHLWTAS